MPSRLRELASSSKGEGLAISRIRIEKLFGRYSYDLRSDKDQIVAAFSWDLHSAEEERLRIDISINLQREHFSELLRVHVARRQDGLAQVCPGPSIIVLRSDHPLRACRYRQRKDNQTYA